MTAATGGLRLLVIDDDPDIRDLLAEILRSAGHQVTSVEAGAPALARAEAGLLDVIILDWQLQSDPSGAKLVFALRRVGGAPILVVSADPGSLVDATAAGADGWVAKPFDVAGLTAAVERLALGSSIRAGR